PVHLMPAMDVVDLLDLAPAPLLTDDVTGARCPGRDQGQRGDPRAKPVLGPRRSVGRGDDLVADEPRHGADETPTARQPDIDVDDLAREGLTRAADAGDVPDDPRQDLDVCDDLRELLPAEGVGWQLAAPQ